MSKAHPPELKKFMDKKLSIKLNAGRAVTGVLRGFDPFMNLVLDESVEECKDGQRNNIGMVVCVFFISCLIRQYCRYIGPLLQISCLTKTSYLNSILAKSCSEP
ncbi:hypothetical protein O3G_MSEX011071 [Manduca sexta]|uniref:Small nuclear ribonucleoprotein G n=1 Tax=Manduca sexta TaxID=7130 RepID=A0A921ZJW4_MANSE|nr:hypothetical protein O3G_MSEX011071 [Manduca sexta]